MARKKFPTVPVPKKALPGIARTRSVKPPLNVPSNAHPRLVHGFLVRLAGASIPRDRAAKSALIVEAGVKPPARHAADVKHEGPADDAIFH